MPSGGILGGLMGMIEGVTGPHIPMHGGAISRVLLQRGCIRPSTHWQVHPACTCELNAHKAKATMTRILINTPFSKTPRQMENNGDSDKTATPVFGATECRCRMNNL